MDKFSQQNRPNRRSVYNTDGDHLVIHVFIMKYYSGPTQYSTVDSKCDYVSIAWCYCMCLIDLFENIDIMSL